MIQRYNVNYVSYMTETDGKFVLHTDHLAAIAEMEAENAKLREKVGGT